MQRIAPDNRCILKLLSFAIKRKEIHAVLVAANEVWNPLVPIYAIYAISNAPGCCDSFLKGSRTVISSDL